MNAEGNETKQIQVVEERVKGMREMLESSVVTDDESLKAASDRIREVKTLGAYIKEQKEKLTKPARAIIAEAASRYDPFLKECVNAEALLKSRAAAYIDARQAERDQGVDKIAGRVARGTMRADTALEKVEALEPVPVAVRTADSGLRRVARRVVKITNKDLIPDEFWVVDEVKVRKEALERDKEGKEQIP